jgi:hypothetical protein
MLPLSLLLVGMHRPGAGSASRQGALRSKALQLLPAFLQLPAPAKAPIINAVAAVVDSFPVFSREAEGTTQHQAYLAQLFALFDALWGAADKAYDFIAVLEVRTLTTGLRTLSFYRVQPTNAVAEALYICAA